MTPAAFVFWTFNSCSPILDSGVDYMSLLQIHMLLFYDIGNTIQIAPLSPSLVTKSIEKFEFVFLKSLQKTTRSFDPMCPEVWCSCPRGL